MDKFLAEAGTGYFWLTSIVVALLVNVASAYLKAPLDRFLSRFSQRRRDKAGARAEAIRQDGARLAAHPERLPYVMASEMRRYSVGIYMLILAGLMAWFAPRARWAFLPDPFPVIALIVCECLALAALVISFVIINAGMDDAQRLRKAQELSELEDLNEQGDATAQR